MHICGPRISAQCVSHSMASSIFIWKLIFILFIRNNDLESPLIFVLLLKGKQNGGLQYFFHGFIISEGQGKKRKSIYNHISLELDPLNYSFSFAIGESFHKFKIYVALNLLLWTEIEEFCQRTGRKKEKRKKKPKQNSDGLSKFLKWKYRDLLLKNGFFPIGHPRVP